MLEGKKETATNEIFRGKILKYKKKSIFSWKCWPRDFKEVEFTLIFLIINELTMKRLSTVQDTLFDKADKRKRV